MRYITTETESGAKLRTFNANLSILRLRGLLGRTFDNFDALRLKPCNSIHTIGMKYPIDAVYLDRKGKVIDIDSEIEPGRTCKVRLKAAQVLELPSGKAAELGIKPGTRLIIYNSEK